MKILILLLILINIFFLFLYLILSLFLITKFRKSGYKILFIFKVYFVIRIC